MSLFSSIPSTPASKPTFWEKTKKNVSRFCLVFFYGLGIITFLSICVKVVMAIHLHSTAFSVPQNTVLRLDLDTNLYESRPTDFVSSITFGNSPTVADVVMGLNRAAKDKKVTMLFAYMTKTNLSLAQIQEIREALIAFKKTGKKTIVYAPTLGDMGGGLGVYYLATAFDEIWVQPTGEVGVAGIGVEMPYLKNALEKLGAKASFSSRYEYKTGADLMTASKMSEPERENLTNLLESFFEQITLDVAEARKLPIKETRKLLLSGPYDATKAKELKLIDHAEYADVLEERLKEEAKKVHDFFDYAFVTEPSLSLKTPVIAYIPATGVIQYGESVFGGESHSSIMGTSSIGHSLRQAADDDTVKAIVLRIDSPGGGYGASDALWREIHYVKEIKEKPIVCSLGSAAASGGYFISLACDKVIAQPSTITGSIGVFGGKMVFKELLDKLEITVNAVKIGENSGILSMATDFNESQKKYFNEALDRVYQDFTEKVAKRRGFTEKQIDSVARGRVFTGREALQNGLIDGIGGIQTALKEASQMAGQDKTLPIIEYPLPPTRMEMLIQFLNSGSINVLTGKQNFKGYVPAIKSWIKRMSSGDFRLYYPGPSSL